MKIHSPHPSTSGPMQTGRHAFRLLASCSAVVLGVTACASARAQSGFLDRLTQSPASQVESQGFVKNGLFTHGNENYRVVSTAAYRTAADIGETEPGTVAPVAYHRCLSGGNSCGGSCGNSCGGTCGGSCGGSCGPYGGGYGTGYGGIGYPCAPCEPFCYVVFEGLAMDLNSNPNYRASRNTHLRDFDFKGGARVTIGTVPDCVHGYELSFTGRFDWDRGFAVSDPSGGLGTELIPAPPLLPADLSAFQNATDLLLRYQARYWSIAANRTVVGWEITKVLFGIRYLEYDERLTLLSRNLSNEVGLLRSEIKNRLVGPQVGLDLLYPICSIGYTDFRSRLGVVANIADADLRVSNAGSLVVASSRSRDRIAGIFEIGGGVRYQLGEMLSVRAGAELLYLTQIATAPAQIRNRIRRNPQLSFKDDILMLGISLGAVLQY